MRKKICALLFFVHHSWTYPGFPAIFSSATDPLPESSSPPSSRLAAGPGPPAGGDTASTWSSTTTAAFLLSGQTCRHPQDDWHFRPGSPDLCPLQRSQVFVHSLLISVFYNRIQFHAFKMCFNISWIHFLGSLQYSPVWNKQWFTLNRQLNWKRMFANRKDEGHHGLWKDCAKTAYPADLLSLCRRLFVMPHFWFQRARCSTRVDPLTLDPPKGCCWYSPPSSVWRHGCWSWSSNSPPQQCLSRRWLQQAVVGGIFLSNSTLKYLSSGTFYFALYGRSDIHLFNENQCMNVYCK